jgi:hypothetical protein
MFYAATCASECAFCNQVNASYIPCMNTDDANRFKITNLIVTRVLTQLLDQLENSTKPVGAAQRLSEANHLANALHAIPHGAELGALLDAHHAAAELHDNLYCDVAGLEQVPSRSLLDALLAAERLARDSIQRAMHGEPKGGLHGQVRS